MGVVIWSTSAGQTYLKQELKKAIQKTTSDGIFCAAASDNNKF